MGPPSTSAWGTLETRVHFKPLLELCLERWAAGLFLPAPSPPLPAWALERF